MKLGHPVLVAVILGWSSLASAQTDADLATRKDLIQKAKDLQTQGSHAEALAKGKQAAAIKMSPSLQLFLATEEMATGALAEASNDAQQCAAAAKADAHLNNRAVILKDCKDVDAKTSKRLGKLTVKLPSPAPAGVRVTVGGVEPRAVPHQKDTYFVSPGALAVEVAAAGFVTYHSDVTMAEAGKAKVDVKLLVAPPPCTTGQERIGEACVAVCQAEKVRPSADAPICCWQGQSWDKATSACAGTRQCSVGLVAQGDKCVLPAPVEVAWAPPPPPPLPPPPPPPPSGRSSSRVAWAWSLGGVGVVGLGAGVATGLMASSKLSTAKNECPTYTGCSAQAMNDHSSFVTLGNVSTVAFIAGGVLVAGGLTLYLTAPKEHSPEMALQVAPDGMSLAGRF